MNNPTGWIIDTRDHLCIDISSLFDNKNLLVLISKLTEIEERAFAQGFRNISVRLDPHEPFIEIMGTRLHKKE